MNDLYEIDRRLFRTQLCAVAATAALIGSSLKAEVPATETQEDAPNTHNMLVVGTEAVFLSHLPMFDGLNKEKSDYTSPHRYQVILEARFSSGGKDVTAVYTEDRKSHPENEDVHVESDGRFCSCQIVYAGRSTAGTEFLSCNRLSRSSGARWQAD